MTNMLSNGEMLVVYQRNFSGVSPGAPLWQGWRYEGAGGGSPEYQDAFSGVHSVARLPLPDNGQRGFSFTVDHHDGTYATQEDLGGRPVSLQFKAAGSNNRTIRAAPIAWKGLVQKPKHPVVQSFNGPGNLPTLSADSVGAWEFIGTPIAAGLAPGLQLYKVKGRTVPAFTRNLGALIWIDDPQQDDTLWVAEVALEPFPTCSQFPAEPLPTALMRAQHRYFTTYQPGTRPGGATFIGAVTQQVAFVPPSGVAAEFWTALPTTLWLPTAGQPVGKVYSPATGAVGKVHKPAGPGGPATDLAATIMPGLHGYRVRIDQGGYAVGDVFQWHTEIMSDFEQVGP